MRSTTRTLINALRVLDSEIRSEDGVANAVVAEAATRLEEQQERIKRLEEALEAVANVIGPPGKETWVTDDELNRAWDLYIKSKEAKP